MIQAPRLVLRQYRDTDLGDILAYSQDTDFWLARNLPWEVDADAIAAFWAPHRDRDLRGAFDWNCFVIEHTDSQRVIGHADIAVYRRGADRQGAVGWLLGRQRQRQGLATEAVSALLGYGFQELGLRRITARTGKANRRSWYLMERVGMRREAQFRKSHKVGDTWDDEFVYALLAEEWDGFRAAPGR